MPFCNIQGAEIGYLAAGNPGIGHTVVFVHGAGGNARRWEAQLEATGRQHYAIAIDLPGHPPSKGSPCDQIFLYRAWLEEFIEIMKFDKVVLAGHSMGGGIVADYALAHPEQVKGLILVGTAARFNIAQERLTAILNGPYDPTTAKSGFSPKVDARLVQAFAEETAAMDPMIRYTDLLACNRYLEKGIERIQCPTLIITGLDDTGTSPDHAREMERRIPDSQLVLVRDAAHYVMMEQPAVVNDAIAAFLSQLNN
jgi:pimeloyl-ACP methyl ester carboxylesterase